MFWGSGRTVDTLTCRTHIFVRSARSLRTSHIFMRVHIHAWLKFMKKGVCRMSVFVLHLVISCIMIHPSILAVPWRSLRDHSRLRLHWLRHPHDLAVLSRPKSAGHAPLRTCIAKFGYLTRSDANTGYEPKKFDKITSVDDDKMLLNDPSHSFSDFSKNTHENIGLFDVLTMFESPVSHVSHDGFTLQLESKESMQSKNRCYTQRNGRKKKFRDQWCTVNVKERLMERCECESEEPQKIIFWSLSENSILMDEISKNIFNEELDKL